MLKGLGLADRLGITFPRPDSLAHHPDIHVTSLVACASLTKDGRSDDFDPRQSKAASRCITERFVAEMTSTNFGRLSHIIIFGTKGWAAAENLQLANGHSVLGHLRSCGKVVLNLPHPSGQNGEYVALASLSPSEFPTQEALRLH